MIRIFLLCFVISSSAFASKEVFPYIDSAVVELENIKDKIVSAQDTAKVRLNEIFTEKLEQLIQDPNTLRYDFSKLKSVSVLTGPKNKFRIYTWPLELSGNNFDYFGFTQYQLRKKGKAVKVTRLNNSIFDIKHEEDKSYKAESWRGVLYYEIVIPKTRRGRKFLLLGWDGHNARSSKKVIEVISFNRKGEPTFGAPIIKFDIGKRKQVKYVTKFRVEFEFSSKVSMLLKYDKNLKMVVFDHLSPSSESLKSVKASYIPDFSYNGLEYRKGKWYMRRNLDARNKKLPKPKKYKPSDVED